MNITALSIPGALLGAIVGSFLNVVILRLPDPEGSIVFPGSHCPGCGKPIRWFDNIPILSFFLLLGKCRGCSMKISWQYPVVETIMAGLGFFLFRTFPPVEASIYFPFAAALLAIIFIDAAHQIIPDVISLPGIVAGFLASFFNPLVSWQSSSLGILAGGGSLYLIAMTYYLITRREGMGGGDIKLLAMIGAFLGWQALPFVVFGSSLLGTVVGIGAMIKQGKGGKTVIPYGPFLSIAALVYLFFSVEIQQFFIMFFLPPAS
ncbi:MAG: prepilin peptidase [Proteobacteria bacterium]|nr:prepilin peptidase [Pseudomonadota bacterium]MBU1688782.1 prepilin peptidase [Pseudomonadota bacterium]